MAPDTLPASSYRIAGEQYMIQTSSVCDDEVFIVYSILLNFIKSHFPSERACPIAAKMAKSLNSSRSHYSYNQYPYHNMETADYSSSLSCPCPMGICL